MVIQWVSCLPISVSTAAFGSLGSLGPSGNRIDVSLAQVQGSSGEFSNRWPSNTTLPPLIAGLFLRSRLLENDSVLLRFSSPLVLLGRSLGLNSPSVCRRHLLVVE